MRALRWACGSRRSCSTRARLRDRRFPHDVCWPSGRQRLAAVDCRKELQRALTGSGIESGMHLDGQGALMEGAWRACRWQAACRACAQKAQGRPGLHLCELQGAGRRPSEGLLRLRGQAGTRVWPPVSGERGETKLAAWLPEAAAAAPAAVVAAAGLWLLGLVALMSLPRRTRPILPQHQAYHCLGRIMLTAIYSEASQAAFLNCVWLVA